MTDAQACPLQWPAHVPRTKRRERARPDHGGDPASFAEVQAAYTQAREAFGYDRA